MYRVNFRNIFENVKNYMFENLSTGDKICYISSIYIYTSGLWANYLISKNILIDSNTLESPLSLTLSSNLYNHFGPYLVPKFINKDSLNKLLFKSNESDLMALAFNRIAVNKYTIDHVLRIKSLENTSKTKPDGLVPAKADVANSFGKIWVFNRFLELLYDRDYGLYRDVINRSKFVTLLDSIELLMDNMPIEEWEVPYQFLSELSSAIIQVEEECVRERMLFILSQFLRNKNNVVKLLLAERKGFDLFFDVSNNLLTFQPGFSIFEYTRDRLGGCPILRLLYNDFNDANIISNTGQLQEKSIKLINVAISEGLDGQLPLIDSRYLMDYKIRRFIGSNKLSLEIALLYSSIKDFMTPLQTVGFIQTFQRGVLNSVKTAICVVGCKIIFKSEDVLINSEKYYNSTWFMIPSSLGMALFNLGLLTKLLKHNKNCKN